MFTESHGINTHQFHVHRTVFGHDYTRYRLAVSTATPMPNAIIKLEWELKRRKESGEIDMGVPMTPKVF